MKRTTLPLLALIWACGTPAPEPEASHEVTTTAVAVTVAPAESRTFAETVDALGTADVRVGHGASLSAPGPARVARLLVAPGSRVAAGTPVVEFEQAPFLATVRSTEAALTAAQKAAERAQRLADAGVIARKDAEAAQAELVRAQSEAATARRALELSTLRSPIAGVVTRVTTGLNANVDAGQVIVEVADPAALDVALVVSIADAKRVRDGQRVSLYTGSDASTDAVATGTVVNVAAAIDSASQGVIARVAITNGAATVRIGETLFGRVVVAEHRGAVVLPPDALVPDGEHFKVFVVDDQGIAHARDVEVGGRSDAGVWLRSGVKAGERVVTRGAYGVSDSSKVVTGRGER